jgi:hypothetical protein
MRESSIEEANFENRSKPMQKQFKIKKEKQLLKNKTTITNNFYNLIN